MVEPILAWTGLISQGYFLHRMRQNVYYVPFEVGTLDVKFTADAVTGFLLLLFKGKEDA